MTIVSSVRSILDTPVMAVAEGSTPVLSFNCGARRPQGVRKGIKVMLTLTFALPYLFGFGTDGVFIAEPVSNVVGGTACFITMCMTILPELSGMSGPASASP